VEDYTRGNKFRCENCGAISRIPLAPAPIPSVRPAQRSEWGGAIALLCGIFGIVLCGPLCIVAVIVGWQARNIDPTDSWAQIGLILGWIGLALWFALICIFLLGGS
jgi:hypothetical protein